MRAQRARQCARPATPRARAPPAAGKSPDDVREPMLLRHQQPGLFSLHYDISTSIVLSSPLNSSRPQRGHRFWRPLSFIFHDTWWTGRGGASVMRGELHHAIANFKPLNTKHHRTHPARCMKMPATEQLSNVAIIPILSRNSATMAAIAKTSAATFSVSSAGSCRTSAPKCRS